jgi:hypothetical protein
MDKRAGVVCGFSRALAGLKPGTTSVVLMSVFVCFADASAQAPAAPKPDATMLQLMRGILYPASNVIFAAQEDLSKQPKAADEATSPNPMTSTYGGWTAVENAGLAIAEASRLVALQGRVCSNGKPAPVQRADWVKFTAGLRKAASMRTPQLRRRTTTRSSKSPATSPTPARHATTSIERRRVE